MLLIFGFKTVLRDMPGRMATCQNCGQFAHHHLQQRANKITLFFIPLITTSKAYNITCTNCGQHSTIKPRQKRALLT